MHVNVTSSSRRHQWHIDHINNAPDAHEALARAQRWMRAELKACEERRPEDADGFRRQLAYVLADFLRQMPRWRPAPEFRDSLPELPGGGWTPVPHKGRPVPVEHP